MKIKNGKLIMYDISEDYKNYLRKYDTKVSIKENTDYYIPFTSKITLSLITSFQVKQDRVLIMCL